jgi:hypothetical protein
MVDLDNNKIKKPAKPHRNYADGNYGLIVEQNFTSYTFRLQLFSFLFLCH